MKKLFFLAFALFIFSGYLVSGEKNYSPFTVNQSKTNLAKNSLGAFVDDAKIVDVDMVTVGRIIDEGTEKISLNMPFEGIERSVTLYRFDILTGDAKIVEGTLNGDKLMNNSRDFIAYTSDLKDKTNPLVTVTFFRDNVSALIISNTETYVLAKQKNSNDFIAYQNTKLKIHNDFKCGSDEFGIPDQISRLQKNLKGNVSDIATSNLLRASIAIESDYEFYTFWGNNSNRASTYIISLYIPVSAIYTRDVNAQLQISYLRVWTTASDPYPDATSSNTLLTAFRSYWNANMSGTPRTIAHYISTRSGGLGGIAYIDVLCANTSNGYGYAFSDIDGTFNQIPTYSWDVMVIAHETGHNFGSPHTHSCSWPGGPIDSCYTVEGGCYSGPQIARVGTIMSYCHLNGSIALLFGPLPTELIRSRAEVAPCLNTVSGYYLAYPNGGVILKSGSVIPVMWGTSNLGNVDLQYSSNNGSTWNPLASNLDATLRTYNWTIPYISTTTQAKVRVFQSGNTGTADESDSTFQIRPTINAFNLSSPAQLSRVTVSNGDTSKVHFTFFKAGSLPEFKYTWTLSTTNNAFNYSSLTNNNGADSVISLTRSRLDSLATSWGAANIGDSLRVKWNVKCYTQLDSAVSSSTYLVTLLRTVIGIQQISSLVPDKYFINPNYPNPFNPETNIKFGLPALSKVKITVYDLLGKEVDVLMNGNLEAGEYNANWNASNFSSGIYIYKIEAADIKGNHFTETRKMVLVK